MPRFEGRGDVWLATRDPLTGEIGRAQRVVATPFPDNAANRLRAALARRLRQLAARVDPTRLVILNDEVSAKSLASGLVRSLVRGRR